MSQLREWQRGCVDTRTVIGYRPGRALGNRVVLCCVGVTERQRPSGGSGVSKTCSSLVATHPP